MQMLIQTHMRYPLESYRNRISFSSMIMDLDLDRSSTHYQSA
jgi:hypothetical protein